MIRINHPWGHGKWHPESERSNLEAWCKELNEEWGHYGHHYVAPNEGQTDG